MQDSRRASRRRPSCGLRTATSGNIETGLSGEREKEHAAKRLYASMADPEEHGVAPHVARGNAMLLLLKPVQPGLSFFRRFFAIKRAPCGCPLTLRTSGCSGKGELRTFCIISHAHFFCKHFFIIYKRSPKEPFFKPRMTGKSSVKRSCDSIT